MHQERQLNFKVLLVEIPFGAQISSQLPTDNVGQFLSMFKVFFKGKVIAFGDL